MLADGQFRIAYYYYIKGDRRAAAGRLIPLVRRYPLYSKSDTALWMLGDIFEKSERKDIAGSYYGQIVKNYPLSPKAPDAKAKLKDFGMPIPQPDAKAVAWMTAEQNAPRPKESTVHKAFGMLHSGPDVHMAAQNGLPQLEPDSSDQSGYDVLAGGKATTGLVGTGAGASASGTSSPGANSPGVVGVVKPGEPAPAGSAEDANSTSASDSSSDGGVASSPTDPSAPADASSSSSDSTKTDNTQPASASQAQNSSQKESSSKKKGLKKILPW